MIDVASKVGPKPRGRPGGAESRSRILECAGQLFAARGFDGVTTRELARVAAVNISAITYYFEGKEGLYHAVLRQLVKETAPMFDPMVGRLEAGVIDAGSDPQKLASLLGWFVDTLLSGILMDPKIRWQMPLVMREFQQPSAGFELLFSERINPMHNAIAKLVGAAKGLGSTSTEAILITATIIGQCMAFGFARAVIFARTGWQDYTDENRDQVIETVTASILNMLGLPLVLKEKDVRP
ncbi:CerR family C-terminal domain-containing protein [Alphaproteobacteria bacterium]|nr:CerR family C-terminal domain-containing protein [Alphaproteobacteria bacterium]